MAVEGLRWTSENKLASFLNRRDVMLVFLLLLIGLVIFIRYQIFWQVSLNFIDSDQPFMWAGADDYAKGIFHEPRFYGQNYNTFFEGFVAVPLIWLGIPVYKALPIATQFIFLFPFIFTALFLFFKNRKVNAMLVLCILLCMPSAFDIMTSMPRGFVSGLFFSSFFVLSIYDPHHLELLAFNFLMLLLGYFVNPNSILISGPFLLYLFQFHYNNKRFYILAAIMLVVYFSLYLLFDGFYKMHPSYVVYGYEHNFSIKFFIQNIMHLNQSFAYINFFTDSNCYVFLSAILILSYYLFRRNMRAFVAFMFFIVILLFSFFSEKSRDGVNWPWYAYSRMYIAAPFVFYMFASIFNLKRSFYMLILVMTTLIFSSYKIKNFDSDIKRLTNEKLWNGVHLVSIKNTLDAIELYKKQCVQNQVQHLLISNGFWLSTYINYGGAAIDADFPKTLETRAERRFWAKEEWNNQLIERFIFISTLYDFENKAKGDFVIKKLDDFGLYLIEKNRMKTAEFINLANKIELQ